MTLYDFNALDEQEQIEAIWSKGVMLGKRELPIADCFLYQIDGFYVEMQCLPATDNIVRIKTFKTTDLLEPYLGMIDISQIKE